MIHVLASIHVKQGKVTEFLEIFKSNVPSVLDEKGCVEYFPAVDVTADLPPQILDEHVVTVIEKWESLQALYDHLQAPHMLSYRERVSDLVEKVSLKVLTEA